MRVPYELVGRIEAAFRLAQHLQRNWGITLVIQESLVCRGVIGLDEGVVHRLELRRRGRSRAVVIKQPSLDVPMCCHEIFVAFALGADNPLMVDL
jgi:hypothetical protein